MVKKLHKLIITTYLGPFVLTFFITLFILVMQFLWKYIDELVGKGLELHVIAELLFYASANLVPMALPLAILLSSIMTFGNLGEHYELVALKSSGLSLQRIMFPLIMVIGLTSVSAFFFSNNIWPLANLKFASLLYDVRHKKPALDIKSGIFYSGIDNFVIRIEENRDGGKYLRDVLIYDHTEDNGNRQVTRAESGKMQISKDERYLILTLYNGEAYNETEGKTFPMFHSSFKEQNIRFDLAQFEMIRSEEALFKDNYQMLTLNELNYGIDSIYTRMSDRKGEFNKAVTKKIRLQKPKVVPRRRLDENRRVYVTDPVYQDSINSYKADLLDKYLKRQTHSVIESASNLTRSTKVYISALNNEMESKQHMINRHKIEWHRKFTLSIACIILFFIGAPLGAIIRKGGLGMPVVVSVVFFLIFYITNITGEKLIKQDQIQPIWGMWLSTMLLTPIGMFLTYKATTDSPLLNMETYTRVLDKVLIALRLRKPPELNELPKDIS